MGFNEKSSVKGRGCASKMRVEGEVTEVGGNGGVIGGREESVEVEKGSLRVMVRGLTG